MCPAYPADPCLLQASDLALRERLVGEIRQRPSAPQGQRLPQPPRCRCHVTSLPGGAPVGSESLETLKVKLAAQQRDRIAAAARLQDISAERST